MNGTKERLLREENVVKKSLFQPELDPHKTRTTGYRSESFDKRRKKIDRQTEKRTDISD